MCRRLLFIHLVSNQIAIKTPFISAGWLFLYIQCSWLGVCHYYYDNSGDGGVNYGHHLLNYYYPTVLP